MSRPLALLLFACLPVAIRADDSKPLTPEQTRKAFLKLLDRPRVDPDVKEGPGVASGSIATHSFTFASEKKRDGTIERVPVLLVRPAKEGRYPVLIVLHGTGGSKDGVRGWLSDQPEMCWSRNRIYDRLYSDCLREIDAAVDRLKHNGANAFVVLGMSLGGNGVLGYAAAKPGLKGVITLVPGHAPEFISRRPDVAADLARARALIAAGQGDVKATFADVNVRTTAYDFTVTTTPNIYLSFFAPNSPAVMPANAARLTAPLLYVSADGDPSQRGRGYIFDRAPKHPLNRYITVIADHVGVPAVSGEIVLSWLKELSLP